MTSSPLPDVKSREASVSLKSNYYGYDYVCIMLTIIIILLVDCQLSLLSEERTSGTIEAWNYIIKQVEHTVHRQRPDVFLHKQYRVLLGRQLQFIDQLSSKERKKCSVCIVWPITFTHVLMYSVVIFKANNTKEEERAEGEMGEAP